MNKNYMKVAMFVALAITITLLFVWNARANEETTTPAEEVAGSAVYLQPMSDISDKVDENVATFADKIEAEPGLFVATVAFGLITVVLFCLTYGAEIVSNTKFRR